MVKRIADPESVAEVIARRSRNLDNKVGDIHFPAGQVVQGKLIPGPAPVSVGNIPTPPSTPSSAAQTGLQPTHEVVITFCYVIAFRTTSGILFLTDVGDMTAFLERSDVLRFREHRRAANHAANFSMSSMIMCIPMQQPHLTTKDLMQNLPINR